MAKVTIKMAVEKVCKNSVRYATKDEKAVATNIYVSKTFADPMPEQVTITIES